MCVKAAGGKCGGGGGVCVGGGGVTNFFGTYLGGGSKKYLLGLGGIIKILVTQ